MHEVQGRRRTRTDKARALIYWMRRNIRYVVDRREARLHAASAGRMFLTQPLRRLQGHQPAAGRHAPRGRHQGRAGHARGAGRRPGARKRCRRRGARTPSCSATIDGKDHWIDTTSSLAGWDFLPHDDRDRLCYVVDDKGAIRLTRTPPMTADDNRIEQTTHVWVGPDGSSRCERDDDFLGQRRDGGSATPSSKCRPANVAGRSRPNCRTPTAGRGSSSLRIDEETLRNFDKPVSGTHRSSTIGDHFTGESRQRGQRRRQQGLGQVAGLQPRLRPQDGPGVLFAV